MSNRPLIASPLKGKTVAIPESRQLDVLAALFERRQATVMRVPLVTILDSPNQTEVSRWMRSFIDAPPEYFVVLTGEGLRRLISAAERNQLRDAFIAALVQVTKVCRGPKPGRALHEIGLNPDLLGTTPTTEGIIQTLETLDLNNASVAVQLYGTDPNPKLMQYLAATGAREVTTVAPYIYAAHSDAKKVGELIVELQKGGIDLLAFTSKPQVRRLFSVATEADLLNQLDAGLTKTHVAAIGPVVEQELKNYGVKVSVAPESKYFMKPLVRAAESLFN